MQVERRNDVKFYKLCGSPIHARRALINLEKEKAPESPNCFVSAASRAPESQCPDHEVGSPVNVQSFTIVEHFQPIQIETLSIQPLNESPTNGIDHFNALKHAIAMKDLEFTALVGEGAFGKVYKGIYQNQTVAIKILIRQNLSSVVVREFEKEISIMSQLSHPNICRLLGACLAPSTRALVLEFVDLGSLWDYLRLQHSVLTLRQRTMFLLDTARGMQYLHRFNQPILHRDLKTPNLLVEKDTLTLKIADFGLARVKEQIHTMTGNCGTTQWMAPEVLGNRKYTEKADVYSFGVVVWEIFTARCPYDNMNQIQAAMSVLNHDLRPTIPRKCPRFFSRLMKSCWRRDPELRPSFDRIVQMLKGKIDSLDLLQ